MRRTIALLVTLFALAFGILALLKNSRKADTVSPSQDESLSRQMLTDFWGSYRMATRLRTEGLFEAALSEYEKALEIEPGHEESLYYLGNCFFELGDYAKARKVLERLTALNPESHRAYSQLGVVLSTFLPGAEPDLHRARLAFERNAELDPEESGPFLRLGRVAVYENQLEVAYRHFKTAAGFASPEGMFWTGFICFTQGRHPEAVEWFQQVLELGRMERQIAERGAVSEGDTHRAGRKQRMSPLQSAEVKAQLYLRWVSSKGRHGETSEPLNRAHSLKIVDRGELDISFEDSGRGSWADLDLDGDWDLVVLSGDGVTFFENRSQNFLNKTEETGLSGVGGAWDSCWGDFDGDKDPDLYLIRSGFLGEGNNQLLQNRGGLFRDVTEQWGLLGRRATSHALFVDFDGDGQQDLLEVGNLSSEHAALRLFRNEGSNFRDISVQLGLEFEGNAVDCAVEDYDLDGDDDLFVLRWRRPAILFRNESGSLFRDVTGECGLSDVGGNGYSALFLDYDGDGRPDLLVTRLARFELAADCLLNPGCIQSEETPRLFRNAGQDRFEEVTGEIGLTIPFGTIQAVSSDFNSDGWPDLLIANGSLEPTRHEPGRILLNDQGLGFKDAGFLPGFRPINALGVSVAEISGGKGHDVYIAGVGLFGIRASSLPERLHR